MLRVSRLLGILFYFAFSTITNTVYAETAETKQEPIVQENKTADSPKIKVKVYSKTLTFLKSWRSVRLENSDIRFPLVKLDLLEFLKSRNLTEKSNSFELKKAVVEYCYLYSKSYKTSASKMLQLEDIDSYFKSICSFVESTLAKDESIDKDLLTQINLYLPDRFDIYYLEILNSPNINNLIILEKSIKSYNQSIFGFIGIPYRYNYLVMQSLMLTCLFLLLVLVIRI